MGTVRLSISKEGLGLSPDGYEVEDDAALCSSLLIKADELREGLNGLWC